MARWLLARKIDRSFPGWKLGAAWALGYFQGAFHHGDAHYRSHSVGE